METFLLKILYKLPQWVLIIMSGVMLINIKINEAAEVEVALSVEDLIVTKEIIFKKMK